GAPPRGRRSVLRRRRRTSVGHVTGGAGSRVTRHMPDLDAIFKAYDIRGTTPDQLDADLARSIGAAFARFASQQIGGCSRVLVARDMRQSGVELAAAFADGVQSQGIDVVDLG